MDTHNTLTTAKMDTTKELIAHVNDLVCAAKPLADQCEWMVLSPKSLHTLDLDQFVALCEWREVEPKMRFRCFNATLRIEGVSVEITTAEVPELIAHKEPAVLDIIKAIIYERKEKELAA